mmetsp:Transcript_22180/g.74913  ORF Transcript_22180/g.74913 Transcript_22180/m.74913 type:complete len:231 (+) Transcript_22180:1077-1769(+)
MACLGWPAPRAEAGPTTAALRPAQRQGPPPLHPPPPPPPYPHPLPHSPRPSRPLRLALWLPLRTRSCQRGLAGSSTRAHLALPLGGSLPRRCSAQQTGRHTPTGRRYRCCCCHYRRRRRRSLCRSRLSRSRRSRKCNQSLTRPAAAPPARGQSRVQSRGPPLASRSLANRPAPPRWLGVATAKHTSAFAAAAGMVPAPAAAAAPTETAATAASRRLPLAPLCAAAATTAA